MNTLALSRADEVVDLVALLLEHADPAAGTPDEIDFAMVLGTGWARVRVVTDHGWLLVPGGMPKVELPAHLVATKWARCASMASRASSRVS